MDFKDFIGKEVHSIGIAGHVRPDGDCIGSCLATYLYIKDNFDADVHSDFYEQIQDIGKLAAAQAYARLVKNESRSLKRTRCRARYPYALDLT